MELEIVIKKVTLNQIYRIRHEVMWPDKLLDFVKLEADQDGIHLGLFQGQKLTSIVSLFVVKEEMQFRKFATVKTEQGKGFGTRLLNYVFEFVSNKDITRVWCNARLSKSDFYKRFGMKVISEPYVKSGIVYVTMEKVN